MSPETGHRLRRLSSNRPRCITTPRRPRSAVLAALVGFVLLAASARLVFDYTERASIVFPAALASLGLVSDLRWIRRGCPD